MLPFFHAIPHEMVLDLNVLAPVMEDWTLG